MTRDAGTVRVVTWNCFGAAQSAWSFLRWRGVPDAHRLSHRAVRDVTDRSDVLCVQELFLLDAERFFERLPHPFKRRDHNRTSLRPLAFAGSGLGLASRLPLLASELVGFAPPHVGAERFARKGALHARLRSGAAEIDVVTTHMQAGLDPGAAAVRGRQVRALRALVDRVGDPSRAFVIAGDFNIDGLRESASRREYDALREAFPDFDDLCGDDGAPTFHPHPSHNVLAHRYEPRSPAQRVDHVLFRAPRDGSVRARRPSRVLDALLDDGPGPPTHPSDHFGLEVILDLDDH